MVSKTAALLFFFTTFFIAFIAKNMINLGYFKVVLNHSPGPCKLFKVNGSEDIEILPSGIAIISSGLKWRSGGSHDPEIDKREGKIYMMDLNSSNPTLEEIPLKSFDRTGFNPHGISTFVDPDTGGVRLFVVSHKAEADAIEIFQFEQESKVLTHLRSVVDDAIYSANNVKATGPDSFYVTNDLYFRSGRSVLRMIEMFVLAAGSVVYYDGSRAKYAATGIWFPNGINMDQSGRFVYIGSIGKRGVLVFRRQENNELVRSQFIHTGFVVDNVVVGGNGDLWISGFPVAFDFFKHEHNLSHPCPSLAITVRLGRAQSTGEVFPDFELREVYSNNGHELKGSTVAAEYKGKLLIGTVFDNLLYCNIKAF